MDRHQNLVAATTIRHGGERRAEARAPMRSGETSADECLRAIARGYSAEFLSLAALGRRRGPLD